MPTLFDTEELDVVLKQIETEATSVLQAVSFTPITGKGMRGLRRVLAMAQYRSEVYDDGAFVQPVTLIGQVFHAAWGLTMRLNSYAIIVAETEKMATLYPLDDYISSGDINQGHNLPIIPKQFSQLADYPKAFRLKKGGTPEELAFREDSKTYYLWDGQANEFWPD